MQLLYKNTHIAYLATLFAITVLVVVLHGHIADIILYSWVAASLLVVAIRIWLSYAYPYKQVETEKEKFRRFLFLLGITASGLVWASSTWLLYTDEDIVRQMFLVFVLMGMTAGAPAVSAPSTVAFLCFSQPILLFLTLRFMYEGEKVHYIMAALTQLYNFTLVITALNFARADQRIRIAKEAAEAANLAKSEFIANISHEIRTPMNAIVGINHLLKQTSPSTQQIDYINKSITASNSLLGIITNILDFSKAEAHRTEINTTNFDLQKVLDTVVTLVEFDAKQKGLKLTNRIEDNTPIHLIGDSVKLAQVLRNLAENAIKFTDAGEIEILIKAVEYNGKRILAHFSVRDTGIGIMDRDYDRLFKSFSQVNTSYSRLHGGTGLGLSISQSLVKLMGGTIKVDSKLNEGSTFYFSLWLDQNTDHQETNVTSLGNTSRIEKPSLIVPAIKDSTVLLIEDDELNQFVANDLLQSLGANVQIAGAASQAFEQLKKQLPDLILLDIQMPDMDGYEAVSVIRANDEWKHLPVICVTAHTSTEERKKALAQGMDDYLTKPIDPAELRNMLLKWLPSKKNNESDSTTDSEKEIIENLADLHSMLGSKNSQLTFYQKAIDSLTSSAHELQQFLRDRDWDKAKASAHRLRGSTNLYGSTALQKYLHDIDEGLVHDDNANEIQEFLEKEFELILRLIQERLNQYSTLPSPENA